MAKVRAFIGSSVEGLNVAYAVQQNLLHEAEVTVWDQGVFELSKTTIESLSKVLSETDFAVFVFSPDDLVHIRNQSSRAVRDNVLFEFGLFIGRLGRDRVFFLIPSEGELHLPTDLLGVTPGRYESSRTDGSMQAATGPVCHQIRLKMRELGVAPGRATTTTSERGSEEAEEKRFWITEFFEKKYDSAKGLLEAQLRTESGDDALRTRAWILLCEIRISDGSIDPLLSFAKKNDTSSALLDTVATILRFEGHFEKALQLLTEALAARPKDRVLAAALARCHLHRRDGSSGISEVQQLGLDEFPDVAVELSEALEHAGRPADALLVIQRCYSRYPRNLRLMYRFARLSQELEHQEMAAYLLNRLTHEDSTSSEYWGYLGNTCLQLGLYDSTLFAYRKAQSLAKEDQGSQWIVANIGNVLNNRGFHSEACEYFERALKLDPRSIYSHERLAHALKQREEEEKEFAKKCNEGRRQVEDAVRKASAYSPNEPTGAIAQLMAGAIAAEREG